jgi:hypothetical protein
MQKVVPPRLLVPYLSGKRTVISGYVYRVQDCARLTTVRDLYFGLDLSFDGSELTADVPELYVMRWYARRSTRCRSSTPSPPPSRPARRSSM